MKIIVANWKMNHTLNSANNFAKKFPALVKNSANKIIICPPFPLLPALKQAFSGTKILIGAQNMHFENSGAFTGEVSPMLLKDFCSHVIIGHSERRNIFNESDEIVNKKIFRALENNLIPIVCMGEPLSIREKNQAEKFLESQLSKSLANLSAEQISKIVIAYEPIWAIGTGKTATAQQAQDAHAFIRSWLAKKYPAGIAQKLPILYGGSAKPENAKELLSQKEVDGLLVGGASLDAEIFAEIADY
jgi:triosephosphate isomerase